MKTDQCTICLRMGHNASQCPDLGDGERTYGRYRVRDALESESLTQSELAAKLSMPLTSLNAHFTKLREEGYNVMIVGHKPSTNGKGFGAAIYSIDSRPTPPVVKTFDLANYWR